MFMVSSLQVISIHRTSECFTVHQKLHKCDYQFVTVGVMVSLLVIMLSAFPEEQMSVEQEAR